MNPNYLFCDEPNSGLDPKTSILIDALIQDITHDLKTTTIVITHDMNSVIEIGDNIMFMHQGKNWWSGTKEEIIKTNNPEVIDFVYASKFMKQIKGKLNEF
jgi:phospholipid/cholesterol/gamma-HCH transport system ATP-binding protein